MITQAQTTVQTTFRPSAAKTSLKRMLTHKNLRESPTWIASLTQMTLSPARVTASQSLTAKILSTLTFTTSRKQLFPVQPLQGPKQRCPPILHKHLTEESQDTWGTSSPTQSKLTSPTGPMCLLPRYHQYWNSTIRCFHSRTSSKSCMTVTVVTGGKRFPPLSFCFLLCH